MRLVLLLVLLSCLEVEAAKQSATPNRYGAIAYDPASQNWGVAFDFARQRDASEHALHQCVLPKCEVVHKFRNGCAALAVGAKRFAAASGVTRAEAETKSLRRCAEANRDKSCNLLAWACTR